MTVDVAATPNEPPVVGDATAATTATVQATGSVAVSDPDAGQTVTMTVAVAAGERHGDRRRHRRVHATRRPGRSPARTRSRSRAATTGRPACATPGTVTVTVSPLAVDDAATTTDGTPVEVDVEANDIGDAARADHRDPADQRDRGHRLDHLHAERRVRRDRPGHVPDLQPERPGRCATTAVLTITVTAGAAPTPVPTATPPPTDVTLLGPLATIPGGVGLVAISAILAAGVIVAGAVAFRRRRLGDR